MKTIFKYLQITQAIFGIFLVFAAIFFALWVTIYLGVIQGIHIFNIGCTENSWGWIVIGLLRIIFCWLPGLISWYFLTRFGVWLVMSTDIGSLPREAEEIEPGSEP